MEKSAMSDPLRKSIGVVLLLATIGIASCQAFLSAGGQRTGPVLPSVLTH